MREPMVYGQQLNTGVLIVEQPRIIGSLIIFFEDPEDGMETPEGSSSQGMTVQPCIVVFRCPKCGYRVEENIFDGPVSCEIKGNGPNAHPKMWMQPLHIKQPLKFIHPDSLAHPDNLNKGRNTQEMAHPGLFDHECEEPGCKKIVMFDDEPKCFEHSPDEGSHVPGYSARESARAKPK
jgi:hypothetical protein